MNILGRDYTIGIIFPSSLLITRQELYQRTRIQRTTCIRIRSHDRFDPLVDGLQSVTALRLGEETTGSEPVHEPKKGFRL